MKREDYYLSEAHKKLLIESNVTLEREGCRQTKLLDSNGLSALSKKNGTSKFSTHEIIKLWQLGFINADLIVSKNLLDDEGLHLHEASETDEFHYTDMRKLHFRKEGYASAFKSLEEIVPTFKLFFHPFRCYVLYHIDRVFQLNIISTQYLLDADGFNILFQQSIDFWNKWTGDDQTLELFYYWNYITFIANLLEPLVYGVLYQKIVLTHRSREKTEQVLEQYYREIKKILQALPREKLEYYLKEICFDSNGLDRNNDLHLIIRLMPKEQREKLKGHIAGAILFKEMVEVYRRCLEEVYSVELPEEDECGFATRNRALKFELQGSHRLLDGDRLVANQFLRKIGLDYGVRVNVYVEGYTEYYAILSQFEKDSYVNVINLKGAFVESKGKGLSFRESLKNDLKSKIFSIIVFDKDVSDNYRVVKRAAENDEIVGRFFVSMPDFEFGNFSSEELLTVAYEVGLKVNIDLPNYEEMFEKIKTVNSGDAFKKVLSQISPELGRLIKGKEWGYALADYVARQGGEGPMIDLFRTIYQCRDASYELTKSRFDLDPVTGELISKTRA
jgi:hypothetical protein